MAQPRNAPTAHFEYQPGFEQAEMELLRRWASFRSMLSKMPLDRLLNAVETTDDQSFLEYMHFVMGGRL